MSRKSDPIQDGRKSLRKSKQVGKNTLERRKKTRSLELSRAKALTIDTVKPVDIEPVEPALPKVNPLELERSVLTRLSFDENKEWAEIAEIFASFGSGLAKASDKLSLFSKTLSNSVSGWLKDISLEKYTDLLVSNGFDDIEFMVSLLLFVSLCFKIIMIHFPVNFRGLM